MDVDWFRKTGRTRRHGQKAGVVAGQCEAAGGGDGDASDAGLAAHVSLDARAGDLLDP